MRMLQSMVCGTAAIAGDIMKLAKLSFEQVPAEMKGRAFGVEYVCLSPQNGDKLFVTSYGWPWLGCLLPERWYDNGYFSQVGQRQPYGVGTVYRVPVYDQEGNVLDAVVKFSRFAQSTMLYAGSDFPDRISPGTVANARINSPFEEFGLLMKLRHSRIPCCPPIRTKRPLGIYCPLAVHDFTHIGRTECRFARCQQALRENQAHAGAAARIDLDIARQYILLYQWVQGDNASVMQQQGLLSCDEVGALTDRVNVELMSHGFRILDYKPAHIILRKGGNGELLCRNGKLLYALVDFELLK